MGLLGGCAPTDQDMSAAFQSEDPAVRVGAIHRAGETRDPKAVPYLVDRLSDSEQDVRFFAAIALERITGETMGYRHYSPPEQRAEAIKRWRKWLADGRPGTTTIETQEARSSQ